MRTIRPDAPLEPAHWVAAWRARHAGPEAALPALSIGDGGSCRFVGSATEALHLALEATPGSTTLVPDYLCPQLTRSLTAARADVHPYPVDEGLRPDWGWIEAFRPGAVKKVVVVHYYGFVQTIPETLRARDDLVFVEDAAHALWSAGVGRQGAMTAFSFRKFMPVSDGGMLLARAENSRQPPVLVGAGWRPYVSALYLTLSWLEGRYVPWVRSALLARSGLTRAWEDAGSGAVLPRSLSSLGRRLAAAARPEEWARTRRAHWATYDRLLPGDDERLQRLHPTLPPGVVPYAFPVLLSERDTVHRKLLGAGVQTRTSWDRVVWNGPGAAAVASRILLLPLHQALGTDDVERVALTLRAIVEERNAATHH